LGLDVVLIPLLKDGLGRARDFRGVKVLDIILDYFAYVCFVYGSVLVVFCTGGDPGRGRCSEDDLGWVC
jgi:hypothetical protein